MPIFRVLMEVLVFKFQMYADASAESDKTLRSMNKHCCSITSSRTADQHFT